MNYLPVCITTKRSGPRYDRIVHHLAEADVGAVQFFEAMHCEKLGIATIRTYDVDHPGSQWKMGPGPTGCWIAHRTLWAALAMMPLEHEAFMVLEDDAKFAPDWRERFNAAAAKLPDDWDALYIGSCCTGGKPVHHHGGGLCEVRYPLCTHGYVVRRRALATMIETTDAAVGPLEQRGCYAPIDISLAFHTWPKLRVYTVLPRLVDQWDTDIAP